MVAARCDRAALSNDSEEGAGMRAIRIHEYGGPESMRLEDLPIPKPGDGQALVRLEAAGVNFIDVYQRSGLYKGQLPVPLGLEGAGVVEAVGHGVTTVHAGDRVAWTGVPGSCPTHHVVPAAPLGPLASGPRGPAGPAPQPPRQRRHEPCPPPALRERAAPLP